MFVQSRGFNCPAWWNAPSTCPSRGVLRVRKWSLLTGAQQEKRRLVFTFKLAGPHLLLPHTLCAVQPFIEPHVCWQGAARCLKYSAPHGGDSLGDVVITELPSSRKGFYRPSTGNACLSQMRFPRPSDVKGLPEFCLPVCSKD